MTRVILFWYVQDKEKWAPTYDVQDFPLPPADRVIDDARRKVFYHMLTLDTSKSDMRFKPLWTIVGNDVHRNHIIAVQPIVGTETMLVEDGRVYFNKPQHNSTSDIEHKLIATGKPFPAAFSEVYENILKQLRGR